MSSWFSGKIWSTISILIDFFKIMFFDFICGIVLQLILIKVDYNNFLLIIQSERGGISASDNTQRPQAMGYLVPLFTLKNRTSSTKTRYCSAGKTTTPSHVYDSYTERMYLVLPDSGSEFRLIFEENNKIKFRARIENIFYI